MSRQPLPHFPGRVNGFENEVMYRRVRERIRELETRSNARTGPPLPHATHFIHVQLPNEFDQARAKSSRLAASASRPQPLGLLSGAVRVVAKPMLASADRAERNGHLARRSRLKNAQADSYWAAEEARRNATACIVNQIVRPKTTKASGTCTAIKLS
jgi:hypothetical protein